MFSTKDLRIVFLVVFILASSGYQKPVFCTSCKYFIHSSNKCTRFPRSFRNESTIDYTYSDTYSYSFYVTGLHDKSEYHDAIVCRALPHMCGQEGIKYENTNIL